MRINRNQFHRETEEILNEALFKSYHPTGSSHVSDRHIHASNKDLWLRLKPIPFTWDEPIVMSRFNQGTASDDVLKMVYDTLLYNEEKIVKHLTHNEASERFELDFDAPIGEGMVKGADRTKLIPMSRLRISVGPSDIDGRVFEVISAYPAPNMDEIDMCWDAIEEWQSANPS